MRPSRWVRCDWRLTWPVGDGAFCIIAALMGLDQVTFPQAASVLCLCNAAKPFQHNTDQDQDLLDSKNGDKTNSGIASSSVLLCVPDSG